MSGSGNDSGDCSPFDSDDYTIVAAISTMTSIVSLLACLFMIGVIVLYKKYLIFTQRLILYLAIAATLASLSTTLHIAERDGPEWLCIAGGYLDQTTSWSVLIAVTCITINLTLVVLFHKNTKKLEKPFLFFIFIFPFAISWIPFIKDAYGESGAWCWIRFEDDDCDTFRFGVILQLVLWYIPLYILFAILTVVYVIILVKLKRDRHKWTGKYDPTAEEMKRMMQKEIRPLLWFPLIYLLLYLIPLVNRIEGAAGDPVLTLWILTAILFPLQGGFVTLVFTLDPETFKRLRWSEFRAAVIRLCKKDVQEYPMTVVQSDSVTQKSRYPNESKSLVRNESAISEAEADQSRKTSLNSSNP